MLLVAEVIVDAFVRVVIEAVVDIVAGVVVDVVVLVVPEVVVDVVDEVVMDVHVLVVPNDEVDVLVRSVTYAGALPWDNGHVLLHRRCSGTLRASEFIGHDALRQWMAR